MNVVEKTQQLESSLRTLYLQQATPQFSSPKDFEEYVA